jgi:hypothetical protein
MADPFATPEDVAARWRELTGPEEARAEVLLGDASRIVRRRWPDIDARITAGTVDADDVRMIVAGMVKRAMLGPDVDGVTEQSESAGPFAVNRRFANPLGNLYLSTSDIEVLDPGEPSGGGKRAFVVDLTPEY